MLADLQREQFNRKKALSQDFFENFRIFIPA